MTEKSEEVRGQLWWRYMNRIMSEESNSWGWSLIKKILQQRQGLKDQDERFRVIGIG